MKIAWSVKIPKGSKLKVKNGEGVKSGDLIYEYHQNIVERLPLIGWQNLGANDRKNILQNNLKKELVKDDILWKGNWISNFVLKSPGTGMCMGVDEFGNIELETEKDEKYLAPISAKKIRVEAEKIVFELKGTEFECEGLNQFKCWGKYDGLVICDLNEIDSEQTGKIVVVKSSLEASIKAEAIGIAGLILNDIDILKEFEDSDIPIVTIKEDELKKIVKFIDNKSANVWLNASASKVLVVLE